MIKHINMEGRRYYKKIVLMFAPVLVAVVVALGYAFNVGGISGKVQFVSGTEYQGGEPGSTIIRVVDVFGRPVSADWCNISIYYPDGSVWVDNQPMTSRANPPGTWVYSFVTPFDKVGNYHQYVVCKVSLPGGRSALVYADKAFHVSQTLSLINDTASANIRILT